MENKLIDDCMKLCFGMMRLPRVEGTNDIDLEHTKRMVDAFIEAGGKYFDTAYIYEGSEEATIQDFTIGWPGLLLQVIGAYLVCKYL